MGVYHTCRQHFSVRCLSAIITIQLCRSLPQRAGFYFWSCIACRLWISLSAPNSIYSLLVCLSTNSHSDGLTDQETILVPPIASNTSSVRHRHCLLPVDGLVCSVDATPPMRFPYFRTYLLSGFVYHTDGILALMLDAAFFRAVISTAEVTTFSWLVILMIFIFPLHLARGLGLSPLFTGFNVFVLTRIDNSCCIAFASTDSLIYWICMIQH